MKIKIAFYSHTIDFAGTWRSHERILLNLNKDIFDVYVLYNPNQNNNRLEFLKTQLHGDNIIPFYASKEKLGAKNGYAYVETNFEKIAKDYSFDIIHFARSGYFEWPFNKRMAPIQIETNIFGHRDNSAFLDYSICISNTVSKRRGGCDKMIYNPIPTPTKIKSNLKEQLNIGEDYIVFGRIGRKDNFHPITLNSLSRLKTNGIKFKYIIIGACAHTISTIDKLNLMDDCIIVETTNDDDFIDKFHNTIDIFLHYRSDGETFGTGIAQSMMYGNPIVSHYAGYNAQSEIIGNGGYVANSVDDYYGEIVKLINDTEYFNTVSNNAKIIAAKYDEKIIAKKFEATYLNLYNKNIEKNSYESI